MAMLARWRIAVAMAVSLAAASPCLAQTIASADLQISGVGLRVIDATVSTSIDIPVTVQTEFGGKRNDAAPSVAGLVAVGELIGPGIETPIRLETAPGHKFQVPGLAREGTYFLQNIRLVNGGGRDLLQPATPSLATITVANVFDTRVRVRQLTAEELRARGISIDARNQTAYEYVFTFLVNGEEVEVPYPVVVDNRTRELIPITTENPYGLPSVSGASPPRWNPPQTIPVDLAEEFETPQVPEQVDLPDRPPAASVSAAIVIPNDLAVLHQFFVIGLIVTNNAIGGEVTLESITAQLKPSVALRIDRSTPAVAFGQPLPVVDPTTGARFLVAQAQGEAEWVAEALKTGTHTIEIEVGAVLRSPGQLDRPMRGTARAVVHVHDPRFNITFSHPEVVRTGLDYSTFSFISNLSGASQSIRLTSGVPACASAPGANVCRVDGTADVHDLTIPAGDMRMIEYRLRSSITGRVFATTGSVEGDAITAAVQLHMGVSESGIPLSPTTLILPHYARYLDPQFVSSSLMLLGLGYSVATAPTTQATALLPRVIRTDVFQRAVDLARAGQRVFLGEPMFDSLANLSLDLLGNSLQLDEWDQLRRRERSGRTAGAALTRQLEVTGLANSATFASFADRFAAATSHREPFLLALVHAPASPPALSVFGATSGRRTARTNETSEAAVRDLPFADLSAIALADRSRTGELVTVGRWSENLELQIRPSVDGAFTLDLVYPGANVGTLLRATVEVPGRRDQTLRVPLTRGDSTVRVLDGPTVVVAITTASSVGVQPLRVLAARQDLYLDPEGHRVSVLFNRPVAATESGGMAAALQRRFSAEVTLNRDGLSYQGNRPISGAAIQEEKRIVNLSFDHALHQNANYSISISSLRDPISNGDTSFPQPFAPVIDNNRPAGVVTGRVLKGDGTAIPNAEVRLTNGSDQYDKSRDPDGSFLFEAVPRDPSNNVSGAYRLQAVAPDGKFTSVAGAVRLPGTVQRVDLVFLGRGRAQGWVRYSDGQPVGDANVIAGSTMFGQARVTKTNSAGFYQLNDLPVGPLTFSATDPAGNVGFAADEIKVAGELLSRDIAIVRRPFPGLGTIRGLVRRSDSGAGVAGARVGVFTQGYAVAEAITGSDGRFEFGNVPAGFVTVLAAEWTLARESAAADFDLAMDEVRDVTLTLTVNAGATLVSIQGEVFREDPIFPGDTTKHQRVPGALLKIDSGQPITADKDGKFLFEGVPASVAGKWLRAYDPATKRSASVLLPALNPDTPNVIPVLIRAQDGFGTGTARVRVLSATGFPVSSYRVIEPGIPPAAFEEVGAGVYERKNIQVGRTLTVWAVPRDQNSPFGDQAATGAVRIEFSGHIGSVTLRLPGQGTVRANAVADIPLITDLGISYLKWDEVNQALRLATRYASTAQNGQAGYATFERVPAGAFTVVSAHPTHGYASQSGRIAFEGDLATVTLQLARLSSVRGRVYAIDGVTPIAGASVRIEDGRQNPGAVISGPDGSFSFHNVAAATNFTVTAEKTENSIHRIGVAGGRTPDAGGPLENFAVVMRRQGSVDGRIVYAAYRVFDPNDPSRNVPDDTPANLGDNAPVPLAHFHIRELDVPTRSFGSVNQPLIADAAGRFAISNLFEGPLRVSAVDPGNPELRGEFLGTIRFEGEQLTPIVGIGGGGVGSATVLVVNPNQSNAPVANADVIISRGGSTFDAGSTNSSGVARFDNLPVDSYTASAYSKSLGRSGTAAAFPVVISGNADVRVSLEFSGGVDGRVADPERAGTAVPGAQVSLSAFSFQARATANPQGNFSFEGVREGPFQIEARDVASSRRANSSGNLSQANPRPFVALDLEPTETLHVQVNLPNDAGADSNVRAPLVNVEVWQRCRYFEGVKSCEINRRAQGNNFEFPDLMEQGSYEVEVIEVGGEERRVSLSRSFPQGSAANPLRIVLPAFGSVEVRVTQGGAPAANATISVSGGDRNVRAFTDAAGVAVLRGIPLGNFSAQAVSLDGRFTASATAHLGSQSTPLIVTLTLGSYATIAGFVDAETEGVSVGTKVVVNAHTRLETITDSTGRYQITGIPTGSRADLTYLGPDEITVGARQSTVLGNDSAGRVVELPRVRLDATPPQLLSLFPSDGATSVSPDANPKFTFSEPLASQFLTNAYFQLVPADSSTAVNAAFLSSTAADGKFTVTMIPPPPPQGQRFPLKSNTLYRIVISGAITDLTGHALPARGATFSTADYNEPRVIRVTPSPSAPLLSATTFQFLFNEPIDPGPWQPGGSARIQLFKIDRLGGSVIAEKSGRGFLDAGNLTLFFAPNEPIEEQSFYRLVFSGVRDLQGNALAAQTYEFFSFDRIKPVVTLVSPVPEGFPLISGVEYMLNVDLRNPDNSIANDIEQVEYVRIDGAAETFLALANKSPYPYKFVGPDPPQTSLTIRVRARDLSGNLSESAEKTWPVAPNLAPRNINVALTPSGSVYPGKRVSAAITFEDEGVLATIQVTLSATQQDNSPYTLSQTRQVTRATVGQPWPNASFDFDLPSTLKAETRATFAATVTDARGQQGNGSAGIDLLRDAIVPVITIVLPVRDTEYQEASQALIPVEALVDDPETGVQDVTAEIQGGERITLTRSGITNRYTGSLRVPSVDDLETVARTITFTARDYQPNAGTATTTVRIRPLYDANAPVVRWTCTSRGAMYPAGYLAKLRVFALGNDAGNGSNGVQRVEFFAGSSSTPIVGTPVTGVPNEYEATYTIPADAAAESTINVRAVVTNVAGLVSEALTPILVVTGRILTVDTTIAANDTTYDGQTVIVQAGTTTIAGTHTFTRLVVLDGAKVTQQHTNAAAINRLDLGAASVYVSCAGAIDVTSRGFTGYTAGRGYTWPNTTSGGSKGGAGGSHSGGGGIWDTALGTAAAPYGSVFDPDSPGGAGGNLREENCADCQPGGGIARLRFAAFTLDGKILANGTNGHYDSFNFIGAGGGGGGSIRLDVESLTGGGEIHADGGGQGTAGGGGGHIAIYYQTLGLDRARITAAGGDCATDNRRGAAGTIFLKSSADLFGELIVDNIGRVTSRPTTLTSVGMRSVDAFGTDFVRKTGAQFPSPNQLRGVRLVVNNIRVTTWPITGNDAEQVQVNVSGAPLSAQNGQPFRGLYKLDRLKIRNAKVEFEDLLEVGSPVDKDAGSTLITGNEAVPVLNASVISIGQWALGPAVVGEAGAVSDPDQPITIIATNLRTNANFTGLAAGNGSFGIGVNGEAGDRIAIRARDGHRFPLESVQVEIGTLTTGASSPTQISKSTWSVDAGFLSRTVKVEGTRMAIASRNWNAAGASNRVVLYDIGNGTLTYRTTVQVNGNVLDLALRDGYLYVVANDLEVWNLNVTPPVRQIPSTSTSWSDTAVATDGYYVFISDESTNGRISIFDGSDRTVAPRHIRDQFLTQGYDLTDLQLLGSNYLIGISPRLTGSPAVGHDVVVIDRREINNLVKIRDFDVAGFDAFRGEVVGNLLYLAGVNGFAVVDLTSPANPVVRSQMALGAFSPGLKVVGSDALVATSTVVQDISVIDPSVPASRGSVDVAGPAWDVAVSGRSIYVANQNGLAVLTGGIDPQIAPALIRGTKQSSQFRVDGVAGSVAGQPALTIELRNDTATSFVGGIAVNADGSFSGSIPAVAGDRISVKATDGSGRMAGPVEVGVVPFGTSTTSQAITSAMTDTTFRARTLAHEGRWLAVASRNWDNLGGSNKVVLYEVGSGGTLTFRGPALQVNGNVFDLMIRDGYLYVVANDLERWNLNVSPPTRQTVTTTTSWGDSAVAFDGTYVFISDESTNGRISIYDGSDKLVAPRHIRDQFVTQGYDLTDLQLFGTNYLVGISPRRSGNPAAGHDLVVIDRRDIHNLIRVADVDVGGDSFNAFRAVVEGNLAYLVGFDAGMAIVDLTTPAAPVVRSITNTPGIARGLDINGAMVATADGGAGTTFLDITTPANVITKGTQSLPGNAWDLKFGTSVIFVATEQGVVVIHEYDTAPKINAGLISVRNDGSPNAPVIGAAAAITGKTPLTAELRNDTSSVTQGGIAVNSDGSFSGSIPAVAGDRISVKATDGSGRIAGPVEVGVVPFGTSTTSQAITSAMTDTTFRARTLAHEGRWLAVASRNWDNLGGSNKVVLYEVGSGGTLTFRGPALTVNGNVFDMLIRDGYLYIVANDLERWNLNVSPPTRQTVATTTSWGDSAVAFDGTYVFISDESTNGRISIYDGSDKTVAPRHIRDQFVTQSYDLTDLQLFGTNYLLGISPRRPGSPAVGHDLVVIDRRDIYNLVKVADVDVSGSSFNAFRAVVEGSLVYLVGFDDGVAIVDLATPAAPAVRSITNTPGIARGLDITGSIAAIADANQGATFLDVASPQSVRNVGTQLVAGTIWDARFGSNVLFLATEQGVTVIHDVEAPPVVVPHLVIPTTDGATTATVNGALYAVGGKPPLAVTLENSDTSVSSSEIGVATDGSFTGTVAAKPGERLRVRARDGKGRTSSRAIAPVPFANQTYVHKAGPPQANNDANFRARRLAIEGSLVAVTTRPFATGDLLSNVELLFTFPSASATPTLQTATSGASPGIHDLEMAGGISLVGSGNFATMNSSSLAVSFVSPDQPSNDTAVAIYGNRAFVATDRANEGRIRVYNITNTASPQFLSEQALVPGVVFKKLIAMGTNHLIAISPAKDVVVFDRSNPTALVKLGELVIPNFDAIDGALEGSVLYLAGGDAGIAIVDLTVLSSPTVESVLDTPGIARGVAISGTNEIVVADSSGPGVTFINVTDRRQPLIKGSQRVVGSAVDVKVSGRTVYVATEQHLFIMMRP